MATHTYESMRITYQSAEQMARAFFAFAGELAARNAELEDQLAAKAGPSNSGDMTELFHLLRQYASKPEGLRGDDARKVIAWIDSYAEARAKE